MWVVMIMSNLLDRLTDDDLKKNTERFVVKIKSPGIGSLTEFKNGTFSFNSLIPIPQELLMTCRPIVELALYAYFVENEKYKAEGDPNLLAKHKPAKVNDIPKVDRAGLNIPKGSLAEYLTENELVFFDNLLVKDFRDLDQRYKKHLAKYNGNATRLTNLGERYFGNCIKHDCIAHHSWCQRYWGTPLNALNVLVSKNEVSFSTVNGMPNKVLTALSVRYPDRTFDCELLSRNGEVKYTLEDGKM